MKPSDPLAKYVCGFAFDSTVQNVALVKKNQGPAQMAGLLNGIGGKIAVGESPRGAQERKFREEAGVTITSTDWMCFHVERYLDTGSTVYFMAAKTLQFGNIRSMTEERVTLRVADPQSLLYLNEGGALLYNLPYLIPMAQSWLMRPGDRYHESS